MGQQSYIKLVHVRFIFRSRYNLVNHWVKLLAQRPHDHDELLILLKVLQYVNNIHVFRRAVIKGLAAGNFPTCSWSL